MRYRPWVKLRKFKAQSLKLHRYSYVRWSTDILKKVTEVNGESNADRALLPNSSAILTVLNRQ